MDIYYNSIIQNVTGDCNKVSTLRLRDSQLKGLLKIQHSHFKFSISMDE